MNFFLYISKTILSNIILLLYVFKEEYYHCNLVTLSLQSNDLSLWTFWKKSDVTIAR